MDELRHDERLTGTTNARGQEIIQGPGYLRAGKSPSEMHPTEYDVEEVEEETREGVEEASRDITDS